MAGSALPVTIDSTYADDGADPTVKLHQQYHDAIHTIVNRFDKDAVLDDRDVYAYDSASGLFIPRPLASADVPAVTFDLTAGGNYTFALSDAGRLKGSVTADTTAMTWTIPANTTVAFPLGTCIKVVQRGTGQITIAGATGVTLKAVASAYKTAAQNATLLLTQLFADIWLVEGGVA